VATDRLDEARALLRESVEAREGGQLSTQTLTFSLIARGQLALAEEDFRQAALALGAADGLRQRAGLRAWPSMRRSEAELRARATARLGQEVMVQVLADGSRLERTVAIALVRKGLGDGAIPPALPLDARS
jgi:hypothetical protein